MKKTLTKAAKKVEFLPVHLQVEYLNSPIGMDEEFPRFSWKLESDIHAIFQEAYEVVVTNENGVVCWESGKVKSGESIQIKYDGTPLLPLTRYDWKVRIHSNLGTSEWVKSYFETGLMKRRWVGKWIHAEYPGNIEHPPAYFRRDFDCKKKLKRARLYATALGAYVAHFNGRRISDGVLAPGWTDYHYRIQYQAYDITAFVNKGANTVGAILGDGWAFSLIGRHNGTMKSFYGERPMLLAEVHLSYEDGSSEIIGTDTSWNFSQDGPIRSSDIYIGERYAANCRNNIKGWDTPEFKPTTIWRPSYAEVPVTFPMKKVLWNSGVPIRPIEVVKAKSVTKTPMNTYVVDFGQNLVGHERFTPNKEQKHAVVIHHGEMLEPDGTVYTENLRKARAVNYFYPNGTEEPYEPEFTFHGFRYLEVCHWEGEISTDDFEAVVIHSDMERTGTFSCSNPLLNQLFSNIVWGQRGNYLDIPTDCPQRDERLGWTGDTQVFMDVGSYNYNVSAFFTKFMEDLNLSRNEYGEYPSFAPYTDRWSFLPPVAAGWSDAGLICPWHLYLKYADAALIEKYYQNMRQFVLNMRDNCVEPFIRNYAAYGDWLNINAPTSQELIGTAFFAYSTSLMVKFANILGYKQDETVFTGLYKNIKKAFQRKFILPDGTLCEKTQTAAILALYFDLLPALSVKKVTKEFADDVLKNRNTHLSTGFLGTAYIVHALAQNGNLDIAYKLLEQTTYPSWLYSVEQGATTIWERWNSWSHTDGFGDVDMNSFNHYAYGAVGDFMYNTICGIRPLESHPGFKRFALAPRPGGTLTHAAAEYESLYGKIKSAWKKLPKEKIEFEFTVPPNTEAELSFPAGTTVEKIKCLENDSFASKTNKKGIILPSGNYIVVIKT